MTDTVELEIAMKRAGKSKRETAKALGLSEMGLYKKIQNESEFKASEIAALTDFLGVPSRFMRKIVCRLRLSEVSRQ